MPATKKKTTTRKTVAKKKYLVSAQPNDFVIELPADWRLTFGAVNPGAGMGRHDLHCLRVYEGQKLRGVYTDVRGFRDLSIPLARKVSSEVGNASWNMDSSGSFEESRKVERDERLVLEATEDIPF